MLKSFWNQRPPLLPDLPYQALLALWFKHRNPCWLFPNAVGSPERIQKATTHMDRGGTQAAMKAVVTQCGIKQFQDVVIILGKVIE